MKKPKSITALWQPGYSEEGIEVVTVLPPTHDRILSDELWIKTESSELRVPSKYLYADTPENRTILHEIAELVVRQRELLLDIKVLERMLKPYELSSEN